VQTTVSANDKNRSLSVQITSSGGRKIWSILTGITSIYLNQSQPICICFKDALLLMGYHTCASVFIKILNFYHLSQTDYNTGVVEIIIKLLLLS